MSIISWWGHGQSRNQLTALALARLANCAHSHVWTCHWSIQLSIASGRILTTPDHLTRRYISKIISSLPKFGGSDSTNCSVGLSACNASSWSLILENIDRTWTLNRSFSSELAKSVNFP